MTIPPPATTLQVGAMRMVHVPDRILEQHRDWQGTADDLAALANREFRGNELLGQELNTRLVRYYATMGLLDPPSRRGKEAIFGVRQLMQLVVIRQLLKERLSLQQIRELMAPIDWSRVTETGSAPSRAPSIGETEAQRLVAAFKGHATSAPGAQPQHSRRPGPGRTTEPSAGQTLQRWELYPGCEVLVDLATVHELTDDEINQHARAFAAALQKCRDDQTNGGSP